MVTEEYSIRNLTYEEIVNYEADLKRFMHIVLEENDSGIDYEQISNKYYDDMLEFTIDHTAYILGAFKGTSLLGFSWGYFLLFLGKKRMHIYFTALDKEYRSCGLGSRFICEFEEICKKNECYEMEAMCSADNKKVLNYYTKNNFSSERIKIVKKLDR